MAQAGITSKGASTRHRILEETRALLAEKGLDGLVLREVASNSGIQLGNLQYYFPNLEALLAAVIQSAAEQDIQIMQSALAAHNNPEAQLRNMIRELVTRWRADSAVVWASLSVLALRKGQFRGLYKDIYREHYASIVEVLQHVRPGLTETEYQLRARLITALTDGAAQQTLARHRDQFIQAVEQQAWSIAIAPSD